GTSTGTVGRIFITGVSPITIDDLGSGANIFTYLSLNSSFEGMCGFTEAEVSSLLEPRLAELGALHRLDELMEILRFYFNGYGFSRDAIERIFNPDMVLYFLRELKTLDSLPPYMLDENLRMDYGKLRALMVGNQSSPRPENVQKLLEVVSTGGTLAQLERTFPLSQAWEPRFFASLLFYHGLLTLEAATGRLVIPNFVIRQLLWENLRDMLNEVCTATPPQEQLHSALKQLATEGDPLPFLRTMQAHLFPKLSNRDYIRFDEPRMKALCLAWLSLFEYQLVFSELEHIGGYSDLILVPNPHHPWATHCVLLELKYLKLRDFERGGLEAVETKMSEGETQLLSYTGDPRLATFGNRPWTRHTIVFAARREIYHRAPGEPTQRLEQVEEEYE
ncbi:MAG: AAA family ATPase, partial [Myxococcota bacterium]